LWSLTASNKKLFWIKSKNEHWENVKTTFQGQPLLKKIIIRECLDVQQLVRALWRAGCIIGGVPATNLGGKLHAQGASGRKKITKRRPAPQTGRAQTASFTFGGTPLFGAALRRLSL
jgi:hypothetical protein